MLKILDKLHSHNRNRPQLFVLSSCYRLWQATCKFFLLSIISYKISLKVYVLNKSSISDKCAIKAREKLNLSKFGILNQHKQDPNSTYRCALRGLRIYNLFNLFSFPIWVTFQFVWHSNLSDIQVWETFKFEWHSSLSDILIRVTSDF